MDRPHFFDLTPEQLREQVRDWGMADFRNEQVMQWVYRRGVVDPEKMTNLPANDRQTLAERMTFITGRVVKHQCASDGTQKLLLQWPGAGAPEPAATVRERQETSVNPQIAAEAKVPDTGFSASPGAPLRSRLVSAEAWQTECVMIPAASRVSGRARRTACVSSQVGCPVGCRFCASGLGGLDGNLTAGQIVEQAYQLSHLDADKPITNVVFMGMGEPLANFDAVTRAATIMTSPWGMNLPGRHITISTVGLPAQIRRLAKLNLTATLAISLHAPNDEIRRQIIPWAKFVTIEQLIDAGREYFAQTGREITLEYILLASVNDQPEHARELAQVAKRLRSNINLIRYNEVDALPYGRPRDEDVRQFQSILKRAGCNVHIRASRGRDIAAACGQLRYEMKSGARV